MEDDRDRPPDPPLTHRRFIYRSAEPDDDLRHPLRRATDIPHPFRAIPGQLCPKTELLRFRVYLKVN
jgi:hypothetical protein